MRKERVKSSFTSMFIDVVSAHNGEDPAIRVTV